MDPILVGGYINVVRSPANRTEGPTVFLDLLKKPFYMKVSREVTSVGRRSSPSPRNSVKVEGKLHLKWKLVSLVHNLSCGKGIAILK